MRVVTFHNLVSEPIDEFDRHLFRRHIGGFVATMKRFLRDYEILPLPTLLSRLAAGDPAPRTLAITFDDGFAGVYCLAFPILSEARVAATVFLPTQPDGIPETRLLHFETLEIAFRLSRAACLDVSNLGLGTVPLSDPRQRATAMERVKRPLRTAPANVCDAAQRTILEQLGVSGDEIADYAARSPKYRKLSPEQIASLVKAGWNVGGHTRTHRPLISLDDTDLREEIEGNLADLRTLFGLDNPPFAYPYGSPELVGDKAPEIVRHSGFCCAFTTVRKACSPNDDSFDLGRFSDADLLLQSRVSESPL
jgi:peptidoglycan/xylan/chitin deacetylase (PgdA/CDA1 family)